MEAGTKTIVEVISYLKQELGTLTHDTYAVLLKQQVIDGILVIACTSIVLVPIILYIRLIYRAAKAKQKEKRTEWGYIFDMRTFATDYDIGIILFGLLGFIALIILGKGINVVINPEYYLIKEVLSSFGK
jgi:hypothetical protein